MCVCECMHNHRCVYNSACVPSWTQEMKTSILRYRMLLGDQRVLVADPEAVKQIMVAKVGKYPRPRDMFR